MIAPLCQSFLLRLRQMHLRACGVALATPRALGGGIDARRAPGTSRSGEIAIGSGAWIETGVVLHAFGGRIRIGQNVFLGPQSVIYGHGGVEIGDDCLIAMHCRILSSEHTVPPMHRRIRWEADILKPTRLGHDVWLGAGVTILGGVTVGDGCVIGAGAVVASDLPPGAIAVGVPARVIGQRQTGESAP